LLHLVFTGSLLRQGITWINPHAMPLSVYDTIQSPGAHFWISSDYLSSEENECSDPGWKWEMHGGSQHGPCPRQVLTGW